MFHQNPLSFARGCLVAFGLAGTAIGASADAITDWNVKAGEIIVESKIGTPPAVRVMAIVQTAAFDAVNSITGRYPVQRSQASRTSGASVEAAIAAAHRVTLAKLLPAQQASISAAYEAALAPVADGPAKAAGIAAGERAAEAVLAQRSDDGAATAETYRPHTTAGTYVPTAPAAAAQWPQRKPWLLASAAQFRPGPPPLLSSEIWARDYNEIKALGGRASTARSAEQTEIARFWDFSLPPVYHGVVRSVAMAPERDITRNARLFATVAQAMDDAMIAVFDAKYQHHFWRPATALRNGDIDGNDATARDASWAPLVDTPMHPEYPCAHCILAATVGTVLKAEIGNGSVPQLASSSPTAKGAVRRWSSIDEFIGEVANARIYGGLHYRNSTEVGAAMGRKVGALAASRLLDMPN